MRTIGTKLILCAIVVGVALILLTQSLTKAGGMKRIVTPANASPRWEAGTHPGYNWPCPSELQHLEIKYKYEDQPKKKKGKDRYPLKIEGSLVATNENKLITHTYFEISERPYGGEDWITATLDYRCDDKCHICGIVEKIQNDGTIKKVVSCTKGKKAIFKALIGTNIVRGRTEKNGHYFEAKSHTVTVVCKEGGTGAYGNPYVSIQSEDGYPEGEGVIPIYISSNLASDLDKVSSCSLSIIFPEYLTPLSVLPDSFIDSLFSSFDFLISGDTVSFFGDTGHAITLDTFIYAIQMAEIQAYVDIAAPLLEAQTIVFDSVHSGFYDSLGSPIDSINRIDGVAFIAPYDTIPPVIDSLKVTFGDSLIIGDSSAVWDNNDTIPEWVWAGVEEIYVDSLGDTLWLGVDWIPVDSLGAFVLVQPMKMSYPFVIRVVAEDFWGNADTLIYENFVSCGDVNMDDIVNLADVIYLAKYYFGILPPPASEWASDVNCDDMIDLTDVLRIVQYYFGYPIELNCCE